MPARFYTNRAAMAVIIANMVGTGVFTSLGYQLVGIQSGFVIMVLWAVGGLAALCGALSYAELGAALPRSGGEYNFLSRIYHPAAGFVSGWVSATIGFSAPIALAAITFATYALSSLTSEVNPLWVKLTACALVLACAFLHSRNRQSSEGLQVNFTALKIIMILVFSLAALWVVPEMQPVSMLPASGDCALLTSSAFAVSLIYVSYAYTGWNAATYLSEELQNPQRDLPRILFIGTAIVAVLYVLLNFVFLKVAPISEMVGKVEVGYIAAAHAFGDFGARFFGLALSLLLISTVSAMTLSGPRALKAMGEDYPRLSWLGKTNEAEMPARAIWLQTFIALIFIITSSFESILVFAGGLLAFNSFLAVFGLFVLRVREPELERPYKAFLFPLTPIIYLALTAFTLFYVVQQNVMEAVFALAVILAGLVFYMLVKKTVS